MDTATFVLNQAIWMSPNGNTLSSIDFYLGDYANKAEELAWPRTTNKMSFSHSEDWGATEVELPVHIGERPKFGEVRTLVSLSRLIDANQLPHEEKE